MHALPNPERLWERSTPTPAGVQVLAGGQRNVCIREGGRVLRRYLDPAALPVEAALLERGWASFRVPRVFDRGDDHLWLEFVPHRPVPGTSEAGAVVGRALREIHGTGHPRPGFLGPSLEVVEPFDDLGATFRGYLSSRTADAALVERVVAHLGPARFDEPAVLLHGDFKPANLGWTDDGELLVLDWEFAYAGPAGMDQGQILRWDPPEGFVDGLVSGYGPIDRHAAATFDLVNLVGLLHDAVPGSLRERDVTARIERTLGVP